LPDRCDHRLRFAVRLAKELFLLAEVENLIQPPFEVQGGDVRRDAQHVFAETGLNWDFSFALETGIGRA
jgi:hypothetical protein